MSDARRRAWETRRQRDPDQAHRNAGKAGHLLGRGVHPKIASDMLGHSTIAITLDLYSHVTPTMQRAAVDELDAILAAAR